MPNNENEKLILDKAFSLFLCFIYIFLVSFVNHGFFRDRDVYANFYAEHSLNILNNYHGAQVLTNEPLFLYINVFLSNFLLPQNIVLFFVILIVSFSAIMLWYYSANFIFYIFSLIILFFSPYLFHFQFVILRQSLATLIFLIALIFIDKKKYKYFFMCLSPFIHSSFFIIVFFYIVYDFLKNKISFNKLLLIFILIFLFFNFMFFTLGEALGFRQINESHIADGASVGGGAFVLFLFILFILFKFYDGLKDDLYNYSLILLIFFVITYFVLPISGRMMSTILLMILLVVVRKFSIVNIFLLILLSVVSLILASIGYIDNGSLNVPLNVVIDYILRLKWLF